MKRTIGVLAGSDSPEREVSLLSGRGVFDALQRRGHSVRLIEIDTLDDLVPGLKGIDVAFNCLHGGSGEDGTVRMLLDVMGIPSVGSGPLACSRAMNKAQAKALWRGIARGQASGSHRYSHFSDDLEATERRFDDFRSSRRG